MSMHPIYEALRLSAQASQYVPRRLPAPLGPACPRVRESSLKNFPRVPVEDADGCATIIVLGRGPLARARESFSLVRRCGHD
jgi:hypothetical protein